MAICRCKIHPPKPSKYQFVSEPMGYEQTASICGRNKCNNPGMIWLTEEEYLLHLDGIRVFKYDTSTSKVRVKNEIIKRETKKSFYA